ncbi:peptidoglycan-binding protein [Streptomyces thermolilacinus]|uniref:peptidoglycan-binding protein n=1 Tax=Streptomyces thermolilacinus TaxID=285540 RepID=UPI0033C6E0BC
MNLQPPSGPDAFGTAPGAPDGYGAGPAPHAQAPQAPATPDGYGAGPAPHAEGSPGTYDPGPGPQARAQAQAPQEPTGQVPGGQAHETHTGQPPASRTPSGQAPSGQDPRVPAQGGGATGGAPLPPEAPPAHGGRRQEPDVETTAPLYLGAALAAGAAAGPQPTVPAPGVVHDPHLAHPSAGPHAPYDAQAPYAPYAPLDGGADGDGDGGGDVDVTPGPRRSRRQQGGRKRPGVVVAAVAAVVAVVGTAAFASGLFDGEETSDRMAPDPNLSAPPWPSADDSGTASPSTGASTSPEESASPSASEPSPSASDTSASQARPEAPEVRETASVRPPSQAPSPTRETGQVSGSTLSRGDGGAAVLELQTRLREIGVYDNAMHGRYDKNVERAVAEYQARRGITGDASGVYGPATRAALEGETSGR